MKVSRMLVVVILVAISGLSCEKDTSQPRYEIKMLTDMQDPVPVEAFSQMQTPPLGSIPQNGDGSFAYGTTEEEADRAGRELLNPLAATQTNLERGKQAYEIFCLVCHGATGDGDGPLIPKYPNPPAFTSQRLLDMPDGRIFWTMTVGRRDMKSHSSQISTTDRWRLVQYIRSLQKGNK